MRTTQVYRVLNLAGLLLLIASVSQLCAQGNDDARSQSDVAEMSALEQMEIAFEGNPSQGEIKRLMDQALPLYGLALTNENYSRVGSVLVTFRKEYGVKEMDALRCTIQSQVSGTNISFPDAAALCVIELQQ